MNETNEMRSERLVIQNINNNRTLERESTGNKEEIKNSKRCTIASIVKFN